MDGREAPRMSLSEPPGMMNPNPYPNTSMVMPNSSGLMSGMRLSFNPMENSNNLFHGDGGMPSMRQCGDLSMSEPMKKKRGRPRKYGPDGNMALALSPISPSPGYSNPNSGSMPEPNAKKRGRPLGSGKKQQLEALGSAGIAFTPHVITVKAGEDVASKITTFSQEGPRTVCILAANGAVCNVTLRQPAISGGTLTYEGRFEIISLSGSFLLTDDGGARSRTGGLSVALAGPDGRVLGGGVVGMLMAATPVQVVMGSFIAEGKKPKPDLKHEPSPVPAPVPNPPSQVVGFGRAATSSPSSRGTSSEDEDEDDEGEDDDDHDGPGNSAMNLSGGVGTFGNSSRHGHTMPYGSIDGGWPHSANHQPRHG